MQIFLYNIIRSWAGIFCLTVQSGENLLLNHLNVKTLSVANCKNYTINKKYRDPKFWTQKIDCVLQYGNNPFHISLQNMTTQFFFTIHYNVIFGHINFSAQMPFMSTLYIWYSQYMLSFSDTNLFWFLFIPHMASNTVFQLHRSLPWFCVKEITLGANS